MESCEAPSERNYHLQDRVSTTSITMWSLGVLLKWLREQFAKLLYRKVAEVQILYTPFNSASSTQLPVKGVPIRNGHSSRCEKFLR